MRQPHSLTGQPHSRLNLLIPTDTHRRLRYLSVQRDTSMSALVRQAIDNMLEERGGHVRP